VKFRAVIRLDGKTATGIEVPPEVLADLGNGKPPAVRVTINGYSYPSTIGSMGGRSLIPVAPKCAPTHGLPLATRSTSTSRRTRHHAM